jgi:hypothetical protein
MEKGKLKQKERLISENDSQQKELEDLKQKIADSHRKHMQQSKLIEQLQFEVKRVCEEKQQLLREFKQYKL